MYVLRHPQPGKRAPSGVIHFGTVQSVWEPVSYQGQTVYGAHVPDGHPEAEGIRKKMSSFKATSIVSDDDVIVANVRPSAGPGANADGPTLDYHRHWSEDPVVQEIAQRAIGIVRAWDLARARGWRDDEIKNTGIMGDPTGGGGRNEITGLALAELMLTVPPVDWPELRAAGRPPWESSRFIPPHFAWMPPAWRDEPIDRLVDAAPEVAGTESVTSDDITDETDPEIAVDEVETRPEVEATSNLLDAPPAAEATSTEPPYPAEHLDAVKGIVRDMMARAGGKVPAVNAVNFLLAKQDLPKLSKAQLAALVTT